jgi:hypothetical protein
MRKLERRVSILSFLADRGYDADKRVVEPPPNHGTDAQDEDFELVDGYLLRVRHRAILAHFGSFISPEKNRSPSGHKISRDRYFNFTR